MRKIFAIILAVLMLLPCLAACAEDGGADAAETEGSTETSGSDKIDVTDGDIVLPPVRESKNQAHASFILGTLEEIEEKAVAIARLKIKNWLGESIPNKRTYFEAEVIEVYKGELPESIILTQGGTSEETIAGFSLFTYGKEMILYLYKRDPEDCRYEDVSLNVSESEWDTDNIYAMCSILYTMNVATLENKNEYVIPTISSAYTINESFVKNMANHGSGAESGITAEAALAASVLMKIDPYENPGKSPKCVYKLKDFVEYLKRNQE